jgi:hypothetical protein
MTLEPIYIVDTLRVEPGQHLAMLALLEDEGIPTLVKAGLELVSCLCTSPDWGEDILIQLTWKAPNHTTFNLIRKEFVTDPGWWSYSASASRLRSGGTRRFFYPAPRKG